MNPAAPPRQPPLPAEVAIAYPAETRFLGQVFANTTNSYKCFWFIALLSLLKRTQRHSFSLAELSGEMAVAAWHPVNLFRLSLGSQDGLQDTIRQIGKSSGLPPNAHPDRIRRYLEASPVDQRQLHFLHRFVPTRFLAPWFSRELRGIADARKETQIKNSARDSQRTPRPSLYFFSDAPGKETIALNDSWGHFIFENLGVLQQFAEHALARYLQARNPNVPGIVNKLSAPTAANRNLGPARKQLRAIRVTLAAAGQAACFRDIYTGCPLTDDNFEVDHFLPWSFVAHNQFWNLAPVAPSVNSSKRDALPHLGLYLPRLAHFHYSVIVTAKDTARFLEDYATGFRDTVCGLRKLGEAGFIHKYRELIEPQEMVARNLGFPSGWQRPS